ncbi:MAG: T9SS type B sorting domain-containing protein [Bacteroidota bacterium]|nr:T9SS type B sorting domain-containing protein [Bacteroidota bacterium]MEC8684070.1 T9SS type B sorting domain-containing protein [Bacteroidota bacterium]MEE3148390.1 T9SS type B sorting domain-containing protein [Bacteroidota bacterium]MEE3243219.1 T9SS type B sorting domain-containing protein [Bacteroidota bacterium]
MRQLILFGLIGLLLGSIARSQGQANNWYFGGGAGLNFSTGTPRALTDGSLYTLEGCASISDDDGNLLFYTDGSTVYGSDHSILQNGTGLFGNSSSTQSALIIPQPDTPGIYYIFTVDAVTRVGEVHQGVNYSIVDFTANPDGIVRDKNTRLLNYAAEKLSAVIKSCDDNSVWLVTLSSASGTQTTVNTFYAYQLSSAGLNTTAVRSNAGFNSNDPRGNLKFSPDGTKLAIANASDGLYLAEFDSESGQVFNTQRLTINGSNFAAYGVEFSPNNQYLYSASSNNADTELGAGNHFSSLIQYDLEAVDISGSQVSLNESGYFRGSLQLAPNGKIYRALSASYTEGLNYLGAIENPNAAGLAASYNDRAVNLGSGISYQGLPPFNQSLFNELDIIQNDLSSTELSLCDGDNYVLGYDPVSGASYSWYRDDVLIPGALSNQLSIRQPVAASLPYTETYEFRLDPNDGSCEKVGVAEVTYYAYPPTVSGVSLIQCEDAATADGLSIFNLTEVESTLTGGDTTFEVAYYQTIADANTSSNPIDPIGFENTTPVETVYARITNPAGCSIINTIDLQVSSTTANTALLEGCDLNDTGFAEFDLSQADAQVLGGLTGSYDVHYYPTEEAALLEDSALELPQLYTNQKAYNETVFARVENNNACFAISTVELNLIPRPDFSLAAEAIYCAASFPETQTYSPDYTNLDASRTYSYEWFPEGQSTPYLETNLPGDHTLRVTDVNTGCYREATITIIEEEIPIIENIEVTDATENNTATITLSGNGAYEVALDDEIGPYQDDLYFDGLAPGFHTLYVRSKNGCTAIAQEFSIIGFSKYFTPNGDGYHDFWQVQGISAMVQPGTVIRIFNRYGKLLKELNPLGQGWDGTFSGSNLPADDYWFSVMLEDGRLFKSHFTLKR